jgi:hypothetical protein
MSYEVTSTRALPRQCDVKIYYFCLGVRQQQADNGGDPRRVKLSFLDILRGCDMSKSKQNYENVREALLRYHGLQIHTINKDKGGKERLFGLFDAEIDGRNVELMFSDMYLRVIEEEDTSPRLLAMEHLAGLTGLAIQLYCMMQTHLFSKETGTRDYSASARMLTRKLFGEDRGQEMPVSSALTHYVRPALARIKKRTGWEINVEKEGRGDKCRWTFSTPAVPQAFEVAGISRDEDVAQHSGKKTEVKDKPEPVALPDNVLSAIPAGYRKDSKALEVMGRVVDKISDRAAIILAESLDKPSTKSWAALLTSIDQREGIIAYTTELMEKADKKGTKTLDEKLVKKYIYLTGILRDTDDELFRETCAHYKINPDDALAWAEANPDQDPRNQ